MKLLKVKLYTDKTEWGSTPTLYEARSVYNHYFRYQTTKDGIAGQLSSMGQDVLIQFHARNNRPNPFK